MWEIKSILFLLSVLFFTVKVMLFCYFSSGPIEVSITTSHGYKFVKEGERYKLICSTTGYPVGDILWYYQECVNTSCPLNDSNWTSVRRDNKTRVSRLPIVGSKTAFYQCRGQNIIGGASTEYELIVTGTRPKNLLS